MSIPVVVFSVNFLILCLHGDDTLAIQKHFNHNFHDIGRRPSMQRVVITGMGTICPLGHNVTEFWENLSAGRSGVSLISCFDASGYPVKVAGEVRGFDPMNYIDPKTVKRNPRSVHFAIPAAKEAISQAELDMSREQSERVGIVASSMLEYHFVGED